jgi:hypothetical protein
MKRLILALALMLSGSVYEIPRGLWHRDGHTLVVERLPVCDASILLTDRSLVRLR